MYRKVLLKDFSKHLLWSYGFGTTWQRLNDCIFILKWAVPLKKDHQVAKPERGMWDTERKEKEEEESGWGLMLPTHSVELRSSIWKRLCLHSYGPNSYITQRNTSLPPTHTHTYRYTHNNPPVTQYDFLQIPKSDPGWNISVRLPRHFASPFVPFLLSSRSSPLFSPFIAFSLLWKPLLKEHFSALFIKRW